LTPYLEIGGDYREVLAGVYRIELPLPSSLGLVNVYLVRLPQGFLLIDCGMETEAAFHALGRAREGLGLAWSDIRQVVLTHIHPDHMGLAREVLARSGARLYLHGADQALLAEVAEAAPYSAWQQRVLAEAGVAAEMIARISSALREVHRSFRRLDPDCALSGGESLPVAGGHLEVVWTPGHSPGHVCLYDRGRRVLFSGDHVLQHITPNIGWQPGRDALGEYLASLDLIAALEVDLILPAHGSPFTGHRQWVRETQEHHAQRCGLILEALTAGPRPAGEVVERLWNQGLSPFHYRFAVFEILAHLDYLERRGQVRQARRDGVAYWTITG
jgi:glyoxylase-like metal-dependent hydrolase (beta-lactamase superfamily II)